MKKELPKPKKSLKSFILDEDAKIMDKSATKIALVASFFAASFLANMDEAHAGWFTEHNDHVNHANDLNCNHVVVDGMHSGINPLDINKQAIDQHSVVTAHANHYNHSNGSSYSLAKGVIGLFAGGVALFTGGLTLGLTTGGVATLGGGTGAAVVGGAAAAGSTFNTAAHAGVHVTSPGIMDKEVLEQLHDEK